MKHGDLSLIIKQNTLYHKKRFIYFIIGYLNMFEILMNYV